VSVPGLAISITNSVSASIPYVLTDNRDGTYALVWTAVGCGNFHVGITWDGVNIAGSPFTVNFPPCVDPCRGHPCPSGSHCQANPSAKNDNANGRTCVKDSNAAKVVGAAASVGLGAGLLFVFGRWYTRRRSDGTPVSGSAKNVDVPMDKRGSLSTSSISTSQLV